MNVLSVINKMVALIGAICGLVNCVFFLISPFVENSIFRFSNLFWCSIVCCVFHIIGVTILNEERKEQKIVASILLIAISWSCICIVKNWAILMLVSLFLALLDLEYLLRVAEREAEAEEVTAIWKKEMRKDHPDTAIAYQNIAWFYYSKENYEKAAENYLKVIAIREQELGTDHRDTATAYENLARVYRQQRRYKKAEEYYSKAHSNRKKGN